MVTDDCYSSYWLSASLYFKILPLFLTKFFLFHFQCTPYKLIAENFQVLDNNWDIFDLDMILNILKFLITNEKKILLNIFDNY